MSATELDQEPHDPPPALGASGADRPSMAFGTVTVLSFFVALAALLVAFFAMALAARSIDEHRAVDSGGSVASSAVEVRLDEFSIAPDPVEVGADATLSVVNDGTVVHDLAVEGESLATEQLDAGETGELEVGTLPVGTYTVFCQLPGHRDSGMEATLSIG